LIGIGWRVQYVETEEEEAEEEEAEGDTFPLSVLSMLKHANASDSVYRLRNRPIGRRNHKLQKG
jgi:hypothetical protein